MSNEIEVLNGDASWPTAEPLFNAVWPAEMVKKLPWGDIEWAHEREIAVFCPLTQSKSGVDPYQPRRSDGPGESAWRARMASEAGKRQYAVRETKVRLHQSRFRGAVLVAYRDQCTICRLKEIRLLDAAHIVGDTEPSGTPDVVNGLSLCTIHHRAFDQNLVGISPDYEVHLSTRLLDDDDGPMLDLLKRFHGATIQLPSKMSLRPDQERLATRFDRFRAVS